jgi:hypothetical protein
MVLSFVPGAATIGEALFQKQSAVCAENCRTTSENQEIFVGLTVID